MKSNIKVYPATFFNGESFLSVEDFLAVEVGLSIAINNVPFTVTMQTPGDEIDLVRGLLYSESIYQSMNDEASIQILSYDKQGYVDAVNMVIPQKLILKEFAGTRNVISASSCGMCGKTTIDENDLPPIENNQSLNPVYIKRMFDQVSQMQKSFQQSGGTHAAGAFTIDGQMICMKEDIGRHNAVDKVIGYLVNHNSLSKINCLTVSGRISYEIVHKAKIAGIPFLASVSAPSSLAVDYAKESGITLLAFCRNEKLTAYSFSEKLLQKNFLNL